MVESLDELLNPGSSLTASERAVLGALASAGGRVLNRGDHAARSGLADLSDRRVDSILVGLRRRLGADRLITVRARGWRLVISQFADTAMADGR
jgi:DNA-binding response OmpR family regulator